MDQQQRNKPEEFHDSNRVDSRRGPQKDESVPAKIGLSNPTACIDACFHQFVEEWSGKTHGSFEDVCDQLSNVEPNTELWKLYCCDSTNCGVKTERIGQSPSVDSIINKCQNTGSYLIYDPGPPSPNVFNCSLATSESYESGFRTVSPAMTATMSSSSSPAAETSLNSEVNSTASAIGAVPSTSTSLTEGSKAAIGICSSLAIIAIIFLLGFLISRRRSCSGGFADNASNAPCHVHSSSEPPSGSQTPLITPPPSASSKGVPLTPPARLSDRRFLPSLLKQGGTPNSSLDSDVGERAFLPVPLDSLAEKKAPLLCERQETSNNTTKSPVSPSSPAAVHFAPHFLRDSGSSYNSGPGGASKWATESNKASSVHCGTMTALGTGTPPLSLPLSPARSRPPYEGSLEIPHLVTPAGPPPNRALPAPPPYYPVSPTFSVSPITPSGSPVPPSVRPVALVNSTHVLSVFQLESTDSRGHPQSFAKDYRDATEPRERETSESWGSWGGGLGVGGRNRGYSNHGRLRDKKGGSGPAVSLEELDLEKLGSK
ncbi:hypothetical protein F5Y13DRAFT_192803 [Hypoxylon sp. FL1857]|nr:hypothetical protein F5Y13DRAFT_192803 [Hypoxylon sp. FL1857]